jgi:phosphoribosylformylglycinamidine synthase
MDYADDFLLFSESNSRFLVEVTEKDKARFEELMKGKAYARIGKVIKKPKMKIIGLTGSAVVDASVADLRAAWKRTLSKEA